MTNLMLYRSMLVLLFAGSIQPIAAQTPDTIPFELNSQHNICIRAAINETDSLLLMFHSSSTGVTLTREAVDQKIGLSGRTETHVKTWGGNAEGEFSEGNRFRIGQQAWDSLTIFINENSGPGTDGKFGFDLFEGKVVAIDYDQKRFVVYSDLPKLGKGYRKLPLIVRDGSLFIPGELRIGRTVYRDTFMFHTGYGGSILLDPNIGTQYAMQATLPTISTSELQDAYGNVFKIETKSLPDMRLAGQKLKNIPLSFSARSSDIPMKVFGNGLMKRFNVVFDFRTNEVYLRPNSSFAS